jgi:hypothetical protein
VENEFIDRIFGLTTWNPESGQGPELRILSTQLFATLPTQPARNVGWRATATRGRAAAGAPPRLPDLRLLLTVVTLARCGSRRPKPLSSRDGDLANAVLLCVDGE